MIRPDYYSLDVFSNSELTRLQKIISGEIDLSKEDEEEISPDMFLVGNAFDAGVLGGSPPDVYPDVMMVEQMVRVAKNHPTIKAFLSHPSFKAQYQFHRRFYGLNFKSRLDGIIKSKNWIFELKSTTAPKQDAFENVIERFDYDRQMYVYMTMSGAERCCIAGCQKSMNPKIFIKWVEVGDNTWRIGKEKTEFLIGRLRDMGVQFYD